MKLYPEKLNRAYDRVKEPRRFIIALLLIGPAFFISSLPFWAAWSVLMYALILGVLRTAYLCKLEYVPPHERRP